jgi:hypothetical protein
LVSGDTGGLNSKRPLEVLDCPPSESSIFICFQACLSPNSDENTNKPSNFTNLSSRNQLLEQPLEELDVSFIHQSRSTFHQTFLPSSYIYEQLRHERIKSMALILEHTDSAYFPCFKTMVDLKAPTNHKTTNHLSLISLFSSKMW